MKIDLQIQSIYSSWALYQKKVPLHCHILDSTMSIKDILERSRVIGLDAVSITDHGVDFADRYIKTNVLGGNILTVRGVEAKTNIGEVMIYGNLDNLKLRDVDYYELVEKARSRNCLLIAPHPFHQHFSGYDGLFCKKNKENGINFKKVASLLDAVCCYSVVKGQIDSSIEEFAEKMNLAKVATSDAHFFTQLGSAWTEIEEVKTEKEVIQAIKSGEVIDIAGKKSPKMAVIYEAIKGQTIDRFKNYDELEQSFIE